MADAVDIEISSSWQSSTDLPAIISVCSSSGEVLEQQSSSTGHVILTQPFSSENSAPLPCWIYINVTRLLKPQGFSLASVCLISSSRTVEIYTEEEEYISTSKGVLQETNEKRAYSCNFDLTNELSSPVIMLKLLSLHGKKEVTINRICLTLQDTADQSLSSDKIPDLHGPVDFQAMLSSLPATNGPPFLHSMITSLQNLQTSGDASGSAPSEISHIASLLRQMRPQSSASQSCEGGEREVVNGEVAKQEDDCMDTDLERRLQSHIDKRFDQLMKFIEGKFDNLRQQLQTLTEERNGM